MMKTEAPVRTVQLVDVAAALLITGLVVVGTSQVEAEPADRMVDGLAFACSVVAGGVLMFWRRSATTVAAVVALAITVYLARRYPGGPVLLPGPISMLALGYMASRRWAWWGVAGLLASTTVGSVIGGEDLLFHLLFIVGWGAAAVLAGQALAARGERAAAERERIAHAHERALASERLRIAQDVHDSVAHAMATINVQSGVAAHLVNHKPEQAAVALEAIRTASRDALEELGSILGVLRDSDPDSAAPRLPLNSLGDISTLVERARADGATVTLNQTGDGGLVSPPVGVAAYRAVQEALTNARRHGGANPVVTVTIDVGDGGSLHLTVSDDGGETLATVGAEVAGAEPVAAPGESSGGFGLVGMRERVEATGGSLTVGPMPPSGFLVDIVWPDRVSR